MAERQVRIAERTNRPVMVVPTAPTSKAMTVRLESPVEARATLGALVPQPFPPDRAASLQSIRTAMPQPPAGTAVVWLHDGVAHRTAVGSNAVSDASVGSGDPDTAKSFANNLASLATSGAFVAIGDATQAGSLALTARIEGSGRLIASLQRTGGGPEAGVIQAYSARDEPLGEATYSFAAGDIVAETAFTLPLELRNQITRLRVLGSTSAATTFLLDARDQWQRVGLLSGQRSEQDQPLLGPMHYIENALSPFSELVKPQGANLADGIDEALTRNAGILMLADIGTLRGSVAERLQKWVSSGGVLVRFAGPRLEKGGDDLLPVRLRVGGRTLGGALSWSKPQPLAEFPADGPFAGLKVADDVRVSRQVLADPTQLTARTEVWAELEDGTPLVTAASLGQGRLVLFHVTGNSDWSNLPLSGMFVEMLERVATLATIGGGAGDGGAGSTEGRDAAEVQGAVTGQDSGTAAAAGESGPVIAGEQINLPPVRTLDGFGALRAPPPTARAITLAEFDATRPSLDTPPGYYGAGANPRSINVLKPGQEVVRLDVSSASQQLGFSKEQATRLKPWLLAVALALLFFDVLAVLALQAGSALLGLGRGAGRAAPTASAVIVGFLANGAVAGALLATGVIGLSASQAVAQQSDKSLSAAQAEVAGRATRKVTLGFVVTGDADVDRISELGLSGLGKILTLRTAVTPGEPMPVNIEEDVIAFYPVLYWPVLDKAAGLDEATVAKIDAYMKQGGMIIFDTRDHGSRAPSSLGRGGRGGTTPLQRILGRLDLPRLEPVPAGHVLTKSFYLLRSFPGRWDGGELWVEAGSVDASLGDTRVARQADGVSSILITSNDFASAWALDDGGLPMLPVVPGGEQQREMSFRSGVNIVMHALTGNYKADQVHVPALLERLGQ
ncbi:MAG: DUF4159 domain-containing protein, partial [Pseudomonadota bacterium]